MKIHYSKKTDYLEVFFKIESDYYESADLSTNLLTVFVGEDSEEIVGYGIYDAFKKVSEIENFSSIQKLAMYSWMIRKITKLSQEEFAERLSSKYADKEMGLRTVQRIENCETIAPYFYPIELKKLEPQFDLNFIA